VADIMARTDGVPLLVEEVLDAHLRAGSVEVSSEGTRWRGGSSIVPKTVREMVEGRLDRISRAHADVLVAGAVLGDFKPSLLAGVGGTDTDVVHDALAGGVHVGLLETAAGAIGFRHAVIREAVLEATLPHVVTALHMRAASALSDQPATDATMLERRAHHLTHVGEHDEAAALLATAAEIRVDEHALLNAELLAQRAFDLARSPSARASASDARARALAAQGRWSDALDVDQATVADHGETSPRQHRMATSAIEAGQPELARPIIARAMEAGDTSAALRIAAGRAAVVTGEANDALAYAQLVLDETADNGDLDARLSALELQGRAFDYLGDRRAAEEAWSRQAAEALSAGRTQAQLRALVQLGKVELFAGRQPARLHEAVEVARSAGALIELSWAEENLAVALGIQGDIPAASSLLEGAIRRCRDLRLDNLPYLLLQKAATDSHIKGPVDEFLEEAEALAPTDDIRLHSFGVRGDIALRAGRYDEAVQWLQRCKEIMDSMPGIVPMDSPCWLVWALAASGRADDATRVLEDVRAMPDLARWYGRPVVVAAADALLAGNEAGIDDAIAAAGGRMPLDIALLRVLGAEILRGSAQVRWLREAFDIYEAAGASFAAERVRRLLRDAGGPVPRRRRAGAAVPEELAKHGVTAREAEVLRLLGEGLANAVIAERLYLSVRTVETHVSSLLAKLHVESRGQLTALSATIAYSTSESPPV
jgi:DNA-binding CsgD family transcriptional regulator/tetratricopeptide (TPR) repeat protein